MFNNLITKKIYFFTLIILNVILLIHLTYSISLQNYENFIPIITITLLFLIPKILEKKFKIKIPYILKIFYILFIFFSKYIGSDNFYYSIIPMYDKIIHFIYGIFSYFISIFILVKFTKYKNNNIFFNIIFCISFSLGTSVIWEFLEFGFDQFFSLNNQRLETGVTDTTLDLINVLLSNIFISLIYFCENKYKKNIFVNKFITSLNKE